MLGFVFFFFFLQALFEDFLRVYSHPANLNKTRLTLVSFCDLSITWQETKS